MLRLLVLLLIACGDWPKPQELDVPLGHFPLVTGGIALPMILQALRAPRVLRKPLEDLVVR